jgi:hypothetical protein
MQVFEAARGRGYVRRAGKTPNSKGTTIGMRPWLYARTPKPLPDIGPRLPQAPSAKELCEIMNAIIRRPLSSQSTDEV